MKKFGIWAMSYGLTGLEFRHKILMGFNSFFFFWLGHDLGCCLCPNLVRLNGAYEAGLDLAKKICLIIRPGSGLWVRSGYAKTWPTAIPNGNTTCSTSGPISTSFGPFRPFRPVVVFSQKKKLKLTNPSAQHVST